MNRTTLRAGLCGALLAAAGTLLTANPADAADARCNGATTMTAWNGTQIYMPTANGNIYCYMNYGEAGNEVRALQTTLNNCYGASLAVDGEFGPKTQAALRAAESSHGMGVDRGRYSSWDAWNFYFWGWYEDPRNGNVRWRCSQFNPTW